MHLALRGLFWAAALALTASLLAISANEMDDFEDGSAADWGRGNGNPGISVVAGGPMGSSNYLQVESVVPRGGDAGSKLVVQNTVQWTGDYNAVGDEFIISMDVANIAGDDMSLRVGIEGIVPMRGAGDRWVTTTPVVIPGAVLRGTPEWQNIQFTLSAAEMTQVEGSASLADLLDNVVQFRIFSAAAAQWQGDEVDAVLGIDNITVLQTPVELQSFSIE